MQNCPKSFSSKKWKMIYDPKGTDHWIRFINHLFWFVESQKTFHAFLLPWLLSLMCLNCLNPYLYLFIFFRDYFFRFRFISHNIHFWKCSVVLLLKPAQNWREVIWSRLVAQHTTVVVKLVCKLNCVSIGPLLKCPLCSFDVDIKSIQRGC